MSERGAGGQLEATEAGRWRNLWNLVNYRRHLRLNSNDSEDPLVTSKQESDIILELPRIFKFTQRYPFNVKFSNFPKQIHCWLQVLSQKTKFCSALERDIQHCVAMEPSERSLNIFY